MPYPHLLLCTCIRLVRLFEDKARVDLLAEINEELQLALQLVGAMRVKDLGALTARVCPHAPACMGGVDAGIY